MAQALALGDLEVGAARWQAVDRCRIAWRGDEWMLCNHSRRLVCALNGRRIATGEQTILQVGDMLDLDLLRFHLIEVEQGSRQMDPFKEMGIGSRSMPRSSVRMLGPDTGTDSEPATASDWKPDLLEHLHDEFFAAVHDPSRQFCRSDTSEVTVPSHSAASTLDELRVQAAPYRLLRDILLPSAPIDGLIDSFEDFGRIDLAHRDVEADVLRLFAPGGSTTAASRLPELTRREHHALSIDSAIALGRVRPGDEKGAA